MQAYSWMTSPKNLHSTIILLNDQKNPVRTDAGRDTQTGCMVKQNGNQTAKPASSISANNNTLSCTIDAKKLDIAVCFVGLRTSCTLLTRK